MDVAALVSELKRRRVFRALMGYGLAAFAVLQIVEPVMHGLHWPDQVLGYVLVALAAGFPIVVALAWIFDVNAGHIERTGVSPGAPRGIRLAALLIGIGAIAAGPGIAWYFLTRAPRASPQLPPSIAVLPFADMSPGRDQEYFSDGIAEQILDELAHIEGIRVAGRTSSFSFRKKESDLREIGQKLSVSHVLEGSVRKEGDRVRITAQVIKVEDGFHLWSQTFDRELKSIFALQDEIAREVVAALKVKLLPPKKEKRAVDPEAFNTFLLAKRSKDLFTIESVQRSIVLFQKALALDPGLAPAWSHLSISYWWLAAGGTETTEYSRLAVEAAEKGVELDPESVAGYNARAAIRWQFQWNWAGALDDTARALALGPRDAAAYNTRCLVDRLAGRFASSVDACKQAIALDPLFVGNWNQLTQTYLATGDLAAARAAMVRAVELSPASRTAQWTRCAIAFLAGERASLDLCKQVPIESARLLWTALAASEFAGETSGLSGLMAKVAESEPDSIAAFHAWRGDRDQAFAWLDRALARRQPGLSDIKWDPLLRKIRGDARYAALLEKMKLPPD